MSRELEFSKRALKHPVIQRCVADLCSTWDELVHERDDGVLVILEDDFEGDEFTDDERSIFLDYMRNANTEMQCFLRNLKWDGKSSIIEVSTVDQESIIFHIDDLCNIGGITTPSGFFVNSSIEYDAIYYMGANSTSGRVHRLYIHLSDTPKNLQLTICENTSAWDFNNWSTIKTYKI